jgi:nifR3 family TIM-barrel protein
MFCEMTKMEAVIRNEPTTFRMLEYHASMRPIGAQLCGSKPEIAGQAAKIIEGLGFDVLDLNCGCPVDKVTKDGSGSGLLKTPHLIGEIISNMTAAVKIPVTVKVRAGWDESCINAHEIVRIAEEAGAKAICIHGRTRQQAYRGPAVWDWIKACKEQAKTIKVIGNGDVTDGPSAAKMFEYTGCDAVLVARATMGQPWIVHHIINYLKGLPLLEMTLDDCRRELYEHFLQIESCYLPRRVLIDMRRVGCWYLKKAHGTRKFRESISKADNVEAVRDLILNFPLQESSGPLEDDSEEVN